MINIMSKLYTIEWKSKKTSWAGTLSDWSATKKITQVWVDKLTNANGDTMEYFVIERKM